MKKINHRSSLTVEGDARLVLQGRQSFWGLITVSRFASSFAVLLLGISSYRIASAEETSHKSGAELISKENSVDSSRPPGEWRSATVGQELIVHDRLRTGEDSRAAVQFGDSSILRIDELTEEEILPPQVASAKPTMDLKQGSAYFFSREKSREIHVQTPAANGAIRGTEFVITVAANGSTSFTILDGEVEIANPQGSIIVQSGERSEIEPGAKPVKTPVTNAIDSAQWCFYYPGVLDLNDLGLSPSEQDRLRESLSAYGQGDVLRALGEYPHSRVPASSGEKVYRAGLFLVAGQVRKAENLLHELDENAPGRQALSTLIAAVTLKEKSTSTPPQTATDWIAESYYRQSKSDLAGALQAAERAANLDANSGFAWTRVAESQFNLGRVPEAKIALETGLKLAPRSPAAHALRGFVLSAENNLKGAKDSFETAIALHSALGDAWLGRGLCLIKQGQVEAGRRDLLTAAALEPNRAIFRRYLSENFSTVGSGTTPPKKQSTRPEKTPRPKPRSVQATPRPEPNAAPAPPPPPPAQLVPTLQIGIGRGVHYTNPRPQPTRTPRGDRSQGGGTQRDGRPLSTLPTYTPRPAGADHSHEGTRPRPTYTPRPKRQAKPPTPPPIR
ncbi:MAG: Tetratricopeptide repeat protein [Candidatus Udaeobacter sp.]|jgi:tetratricopeptide (TPR) repeat protein|nr:MAG: Tetratricopeptide repeat protein [Candidatus Udaeobacter sp.]